MMSVVLIYSVQENHVQSQQRIMISDIQKCFFILDMKFSLLIRICSRNYIERSITFKAVVWKFWWFLFSVGDKFQWLMSYSSWLRILCLVENSHYMQVSTYLFEVLLWKVILLKPYIGWIRMWPKKLSQPIGQYISHGYWKQIYCLNL